MAVALTCCFVSIEDLPHLLRMVQRPATTTQSRLGPECRRGQEVVSYVQWVVVEELASLSGLGHFCLHL